MPVLHKTVVAAAPASCANLGPGFDVFGVALSEPEDRIELEIEDSSTFSLDFEVEGSVPREPEKNAAAFIISSIAKKYRIRKRIKARLKKGVPVGVGLGSSAASSVVSTFAMNIAFKLRMDVMQILAFSSQGEKLCSGAAHLDNITASLLGGFTISPSRFTPPVSIKPPESLALCIVTPQVQTPERKTEYARSLLPEKVDLSDVVSNIRNASLVVAGMALSDIDILGMGMEDYIVERSRLKMNPHYLSVKLEAKKAGASGVCISGAGPSVLAIVDSSKRNPRIVLESMLQSYRNAGIKAEGFVTKTGKGARIVS